MSNNCRDTFRELRKDYADGSEPFMRGHQIIKIRQPPRIRREYWVNSEKRVHVFLLRLFPKTRICVFKNKQERRAATKQLERAALYGAVIQLYFRAGLTASRVASAINREEEAHLFDYKAPKKLITVARVNRIVQDIRTAARGERRDGKPRSFGKPGRPRKNSTVVSSVNLTKETAKPENKNEIVVPEPLWEAPNNPIHSCPDRNVRFQTCQFDADLRRSTTPTGTDHLSKDRSV